jgi:hypothetical protein
MDRGATYIGMSPNSVSSGAPFSSMMRARVPSLSPTDDTPPSSQAIRSFAADPRGGPFQAMNKGIIPFFGITDADTDTYMTIISMNIRTYILPL